MSNWRNHYDSWKLASGITQYDTLDEDGEPVDQDSLDVQAEAAAEERDERQREDAIFDSDDRSEEWATDAERNAGTFLRDDRP